MTVPIIPFVTKARSKQLVSAFLGTQPRGDDVEPGFNANVSQTEQ